MAVVGDLVLQAHRAKLVALAADDGEERWHRTTGGLDRVATDGTVAYVG